MERLEHRLQSFLRTGQGDFETMALEIFAYQFERNRLYQAFCTAQDKTPDHVNNWEDIPAVPIRAFKSAELATFPIGQAAAEFRSSGTTQKTPSRHYLKSLSYYEASLQWGFEKWVVTHPGEAKLPFLILAPSPAEAPHSSLSWMLDVVMRKWGDKGSDYFLQRGLLDDRRLVSALRQHERDGKPVALLGTTLAFLTLFDRLERSGERLRCPSGSRLMDTGGMKTQTRQVLRDEFVGLAEAYLGLTESMCINEYGMCELSSQFYAVGRSQHFSGPPWVRTRVIDGLLMHFDLANLDSVAAIQTEDVGEIKDDGFVLKGRAPHAELKGCSLAAEAYLSRD